MEHRREAFGMTEKTFDLAILGGGPGGYTAAIRAAQLGMSVGLVEKRLIGGTCLNIGCIPTKALIHCAGLYEEARNAKTFGLSIPEVAFEWARMQQFKKRCVVKLRKGVESLMKKNKIEVIEGHGRLKAVDLIEVDGVKVRGKNIILAPGSRSKTLPSLPIDGSGVITSDHALELEELPESLLVVGAGAIGCEFAYFMSALGVDVRMVEFLDHALPMEDEELSVEFEKALKLRRIELHLRCSVEGVKKSGEALTAQVRSRDGGNEFEIETDKVLVSVGRDAATDDCGLEEVGIPMEKGLIKADPFLNTGVGAIKAIGDASGGLMLAHKASAEGILAAELIAGIEREPLTMEKIPRATYTKPEVASVGLTESQAKEQCGEEVKSGRFPFGASGKAVSIGDSLGFVKLIACGDEGRLVGAHAIGPNAAELIAVALTAINLEATAEGFARVVHAHPTLSEVWGEAAHDLLDGALNA